MDSRASLQVFSICVTLALLTLAGCGGSVSAVADERAEPHAAQVEPMALVAAAPETEAQPPGWRLGDHRDALKAASCPKGHKSAEPEALAIEAREIMDADEIASFGQSDGVRLDGAVLSAAYELLSPDTRFGGLSGLADLAPGHMLALTDVGRVVWLDMDDETGTRPVAGRIADLLSASGKPLVGKLEGDSEGLAIRDGLALVSFEGHHRVSAFDLDDCGAAAGEVIVTELPSLQDGVPDLGRNGGPEALALAPDGGLVIGVETLDAGKAPISLSPLHGAYDFSDRMPFMGGMSLTGADVVEEADGKATLYAVHRSFGMLTGINVAVTETDLSRDEAGRWSMGQSRRLVRMASPAPLDNFEGVVVRQTPEGRKLFLIADDNFSGRQRSLFFVFDLTQPPLAP